MGQLGLIHQIKYSKRHFEIHTNYDTRRPILKTSCIRAQFDDFSAASEPRRQNQEAGRGRREPLKQSGGGRGGGRGRNFPQRQESQRSSTRDDGRNNITLPISPKCDMLVVVEGVNDMKAVRKTLNADVYVLGTATRAGDPEVHNELLSLLKQYKGIVLLLDPDVAGRQARNMLNKAIIDCWHAFVPSPLAQATQVRGYKEIGNIGVEHAPPKAIMEALKRRRRGVEGRTEFSKEKLCELGLAAAEFERGGNVRERRSLVCAFLGIGMSDGKQLVKQLNTYGFSQEDVAAALVWAEPQLATTQSNALE